VGRLAAGSQAWRWRSSHATSSSQKLRAYMLICKLEARGGGGGRELGMTWAIETSKPTSSDTPSPRRLGLLILPKQFYQLKFNQAFE
jgi:hypothetical protein